MARLLSALDGSRYEPRVLLLADGPLAARLRGDGVRTAVLPAPEQLTGVGRAEVVTARGLASTAARSAAQLPRLVAAIRGSGAELVVANSLKSAVLTAVAAPLAGRPWVWHLHDRIAPDYLPGSAVRALRALARLPRHVVVNSRATRATLPGLPEAHVTVAYPGLDVAGPVTPRRPARAPAFGLIGRIAPTKGQLEFLRAAARLAGDRPDVAFRVIGDAMFNDADFAALVRALPRELGIADRVTFTGWIDDPADELASLTALVHASPVPEPFGQVIVEAMLAGTPVIGTDAGGVPEILDPDAVGAVLAPGVTRAPLGLLVAPADPVALASAMRWVAEHPGEAAGLAAAARASAVERFDVRLGARSVERAWGAALRHPISAGTPGTPGKGEDPRATPFHT